MNVHHWEFDLWRPALSPPYFTNPVLSLGSPHHSKLYLDRKICFHIGITLAVLYFASLKDIRQAFSKFCVIIQRPQVVQQDKHLTFLRTKAQFAIVSLNNLFKAIYNYLFIITCPHPDFFKKKILQFRLSTIK